MAWTGGPSSPGAPPLSEAKMKMVLLITPLNVMQSVDQAFNSPVHRFDKSFEPEQLQATKRLWIAK